MPSGEPDHVPAPQPTPRFAPRSRMAPGALALLALAAIVVAASRMTSPPWAAPSTRQPEGVAKTRSIQPGGVDSHHGLLWHSLANPPSSAAQCVLLAKPEGKPAQQTCLFANVCVNKTERSITMFNGVRAPNVELIPRTCAGKDSISLPVKLRSSPQSFADFVNETGAPVHRGLWVWMDRYVDYNFAHTL